ncbi:LEAF RUST 10 DISEASE-RESISTANCE LOCUS RECEPTOR-LIKE PROTEIN KINASE-like 1.2 isoform X1 [Lolium rigidum]|uniref:LEAF RUST 10 DISEASE-RESISTANCE LOCUS RECEPTOR-LIKE PROTEIN KINASE-like 1.2 isoform X1 n=1 Tax=Lolium rigidum TaxID=89674 RepID=UPI001F5C8D54|nr:LEAF RUST 10 DISEASE-RESISTANCE LOCUS RECEPTOR-LIKE PROTEIN KINASE-like 1.2 isoform X1 [Lolium rigidum]
MGIVCDDDKPILQLDGVNNYAVKSVEGSRANVSFADPEAVGSCPRVKHNVTFSQGSWLEFPNTTVDYIFLFLSCYFDFNLVKPDSIEQITCSGFASSGMSFVLPNASVPAGNWSRACGLVTKVPVLKYDPVDPNDDSTWLNTGYGDVLRQGFQVSWDNRSAECIQCERSNGRCGYKQSGDFLGCLCADRQIDDRNCTMHNSTGSKGKGKAAIGGVVAGAAGLLLVAAAIAFFLIRRRKQRKVVNSSSKLLKYSGSGGTPTRSRDGFDLESGSVQGMGSRFSYEELEEATDSFNENRELGDGGFGTVYKGYLEDGRVVAVKKLYNNSYRRVEQFVNEAAILARLRHPNLVMFYGCTSKESRDLLLVYEFVQNGTVADHLHGHRAAERALPWPLRLNIAIESAAALTYLHAIEPPIIHRDVKTNNILLDGDFHVKVADFGLSRLFPLDVTHVSTAPQGTPGYVDPEYHQCYQLTDKSDVYSFGVVLVELISSKPAVDITRQRNEINLAGMAINRIQKCQLEELVDLQLGYESDPATKKMMTMVAELAFRCLQQNGEMRPPIKEVHDVLRAIKDGSVAENGRGGKDKDLDPPFSPNTVHAPWDSRSTTPNTSQ